MANPEQQSKFLKAVGPLVQEHVSLREVTPFGVGGVADYYAEVETLEQLMLIVKSARESQIPWLIIGDGTQTVMSDVGFPGLVIRNRTSRLQFVPGTGQVLADSGVLWSHLVTLAANKELGGMESMLTVSGTVGGTLSTRRLAQSGLDVCTLLRRVTVLDEEGEPRQMSPQRFLRYQGDKWVILVASLQMVHTRRDELMRRITIYEKMRRKYLERNTHWLGPVFGLDEDTKQDEDLSKIFEQSKVYGLKVGGAVFSSARPNYIETNGRVTAQEVRDLIGRVYTKMSEITKTTPTIQIKFVGQWMSGVEESSL